MTDRIDVTLKEESNLMTAIEQNIEYIKRETLTEKLVFQETVGDGIEIAFDGIETQLQIKKH